MEEDEREDDVMDDEGMDEEFMEEENGEVIDTETGYEAVEGDEGEDMKKAHVNKSKRGKSKQKNIPDKKEDCVEKQMFHAKQVKIWSLF